MPGDGRGPGGLRRIAAKHAGTFGRRDATIARRSWQLAPRRDEILLFVLRACLKGGASIYAGQRRAVPEEAPAAFSRRYRAAFGTSGAFFVAFPHDLVPAKSGKDVVASQPRRS